VERHLRALHAEDRLERVSGLELAIRARLALNDTVGAGSALTELEEIAAIVDTDPLRASLLFSEGLIAASGSDHDRARRRFEDALDLWTRSGMPFEAAKARLELARTLFALARPDAAVREARLASEGFASLGAAGEQRRAATLLRTLESKPGDSADGATGTTVLTERERQVLGLIAQGLSNPQIAARLVLSEHTVHRHVANILQKLEVSSRAAAVASAAHQGLL
jgi:ATP/maltotriose-dependent transcriptional regulator MalT